MSPGMTSIVGVGLACPLGLNSEQAVHAMEAGISCKFEVDPPSTMLAEPVRISCLDQLDNTLDRTSRASFFARHAMREAFTGLRRLFTSKPVPCLLALPEPATGPGLDLRTLAVDLTTVVADASGLQIVLRPPWLFPEGRAGVFRALDAAVALLDAGHCDLAVVGGLDSLVAPEVLTYLVEHERVRSNEMRDGTTPGEGAAFLVLAHPRVSPVASARATVHAVALGEEPHPLLDRRPSAADGLTTVFRSLREQMEGRVDAVFSAQTDQGYYGSQFAYASMRNAALMPVPPRRSEVGSSLGDTGAAAGAIALVQAVARMRPSVLSRHAAPPRSALIYGMSDHGVVGGCVVVHP